VLCKEITVDQAKVADLCREFGVARLSVFGSALRPDFDVERSDVDLLVEFFPHRVPGLLAFVDLEEQLSGVFMRRVDLSTSASPSKCFRDDVLASAEPIYVAS
jgi:predicted nucleotidyltransferase